MQEEEKKDTLTIRPLEVICDKKVVIKNKVEEKRNKLMHNNRFRIGKETYIVS